MEVVGIAVGTEGVGASVGIVGGVKELGRRVGVTVGDSVGTSGRRDGGRSVAGTAG